jgi:hypothetical protein
MIFMNNGNPLKQVINLMIKGKIILTLNGQIPH